MRLFSEWNGRKTWVPRAKSSCPGLGWRTEHGRLALSRRRQMQRRSCASIKSARALLSLVAHGRRICLAGGRPAQARQRHGSGRLRPGAGSQTPAWRTFSRRIGPAGRAERLFRPEARHSVLCLLRLPAALRPGPCGAFRRLKPLSLEAGKDFDVIAFSINPDESPALAQSKKIVFLERYDRPGSGGLPLLDGGISFDRGAGQEHWVPLYQNPRPNFILTPRAW